MLREAGDTGAERFFLAGDFDIELWMLNDEEECVDFHGPFGWADRKGLASCGQDLCRWISWRNLGVVWLLLG